MVHTEAHKRTRVWVCSEHGLGAQAQQRKEREEKRREEKRRGERKKGARLRCSSIPEPTHTRTHTHTRVLSLPSDPSLSLCITAVRRSGRKRRNRGERERGGEKKRGSVIAFLHPLPALLAAAHSAPRRHNFPPKKSHRLRARASPDPLREDGNRHTVAAEAVGALNGQGARDTWRRSSAMCHACTLPAIIPRKVARRPPCRWRLRRLRAPLCSLALSLLSLGGLATARRLVACAGLRNSRATRQQAVKKKRHRLITSLKSATDIGCIDVKGDTRAERGAERGKGANHGDRSGRTGPSSTPPLPMLSRRPWRRRPSP